MQFKFLGGINTRKGLPMISDVCLHYEEVIGHCPGQPKLSFKPQYFPVGNMSLLKMNLSITYIESICWLCLFPQLYTLYTLLRKMPNGQDNPLQWDALKKCGTVNQSMPSPMSLNCYSAICFICCLVTGP
jgi:hypothetical protein